MTREEVEAAVYAFREWLQDERGTYISNEEIDEFLDSAEEEGIIR